MSSWRDSSRKTIFLYISKITTGCQTLFIYPTCCVSRAPQLWVHVGQRFIEHQCTCNTDSLSSTSHTCMDSSTTNVSRLSSQYVIFQQGPQRPVQTDLWTQFCHTQQCGKIPCTVIPSQQLKSVNYNCNSTNGTILSHSRVSYNQHFRQTKRPNTAALWWVLTSQAPRPASTLLSYLG